MTRTVHRRIGFVIAAAVLFIATPAEARQEREALALGSVPPLAELAMATTTGEQISISDARMENGVMVVFTCNTCPWVDRWENRYPVINAAANEAGVGVLMLNPNEALRDGEESLEAMRERAESRGYEFPYAVDAGSAIAVAFGATRTPEVFLFDADLKLIYHGAIDDNARDASAVEAPFVLDAISAYSEGRPIKVAETSSIGCTIKFPRS